MQNYLFLLYYWRVGSGL